MPSGFPYIPSNPLKVANGGSGTSVGSLTTLPSALAQRGSVAPTITYSTTAMASAQYVPAFAGTTSLYTAPTGGVNNAMFGCYGASSGMGPRHPSAVPQVNVLQAGLDTPEVYGGTPFWTVFHHTGAQLDLIKYGSGAGFSLCVDDVFIANAQPLIATGTAQAGAATTLTLAAADAGTLNQYIGCSVVIISGTGAGQVRKITAYSNTTKVATVGSAWTTAPASGSVYAVVHDQNGIYTQPGDGSLYYYNLNFGSVATRKIALYASDFMGINIGPNDAVAPGAAPAPLRAVVVGDSFIEGVGGPMNAMMAMDGQIGQRGGWTIYPDGEGGTGWVNPNTSAGKLNFMDRIAPPAESWAYLLVGASAGTYTLSVTYNGTTQTTGALAWNAGVSAVQTAMQGLSNVPAGAVSVGGGGDAARPFFVLLHNMAGAVLTVNTAGLTFTSLRFARWAGVVAGRVPTDGVGNPLPFLLVVQGSGNDMGGGFSSAQVQTNAVSTAQQIAQRFPSAVTVFTGVVSVVTHGGGGLIDATDIGYNAAIKAGAQSLPTVNGAVPFVDTYAAGVGGLTWITGTGNVANPTSGKTDSLISALVGGHPTGDGHSYLAARVVQAVKRLVGSF